MKQLKKTILTLVALLAVTTGAWADETPIATILASENSTFVSGSKTFADKVKITFSGAVDWVNNRWQVVYDSTNGNEGTVTVEGVNGTNISKVVFYDEYGSHVMTTSPYTLYFYQAPERSDYIVCTGANGEGETDLSMITKIEVYGGVASSAASGPEVAWDKAEKTGTFKMPGGNVTLEPEYYPQATVAEGAVTAADADARATTDDPLVKVDATKLTGAKKLMYFVSNSGTTAPAYDAEGWTDQLPTAEGFTQQGIVYVWYYPVGTDEGDDGATATYSDGDICKQSITARIADAPTYAVEFAEGTEESDKWKADPATGVKKGQTVTVTYTGTKKVIGVKAEKKAAEPVADIIWDGTNVTDLNVESTYASYTKEGVKLSGNADEVQVKWNNSAYLGTPGMEFITMESGGFTFTAPTGKAFTKIEMKAQGHTGWNNVNLGTGWAFNADMDKQIFTVTWTGSAASTVKLLKDADMFSGDFISSIAFYLSE